MTFRSRPGFLLSALALAAAGCAAQADLGDMRREQRLLARRLADTRADLESLRIAVSRLQGRVDDLGPRAARSLPPDPERRERAVDATVAPPRYDVPPAQGTAGPPTSIDATVPPPPEPGTIQGGRVWPPENQNVAPQGSTRPTDAATGPDGAPTDLGATTALPAVDGPTIDVARDLARGGPTGYREGLEAFQRGEYPRSIQLLRTFANQDAKNELVPSARYWIGEGYFAQRRYNEAILAYNEILVGWPSSDRVPAALLRQADAFTELGDRIDARLTLKKLVDRHPGTEEAAIAKRKLLSLGS